MNTKWKFIASARYAADSLWRGLSAGVSRPAWTTIVKGSIPPSPPDQGGLRDTAIVQDVSTSMGSCDYLPTRLGGGVHAADSFVDTCRKRRPGDRVAIVSFHDEARIVLTWTAVTEAETIQAALHQLTADGGTDLTQGLKAAAELFKREPPCRRQRRVILLTDGQGGEPLAMADQLKGPLGVVIDVVGIGGSVSEVNEVLLRQVATTDPDGFCHYRFIKDPDALSEHYTQLATGLVWKGGPK